MTRILMALLVLGLGVSLTSIAAPDTKPPAETKIPKDTCVKPSLDCAKECLEGMKHAKEAKLDEVARHLEISHHICVTCALTVGSKNPAAWDTCTLCERICNDCAVECDKTKDEHMKKCAETLRACAKACQEARK